MLTTFQHLADLIFAAFPLPSQQGHNRDENLIYWGRFPEPLADLTKDIVDMISTDADAIIAPSGAALSLSTVNGYASSPDYDLFCAELAAAVECKCKDCDHCYCADGKWLKLIQDNLPTIIQFILMFVK